MAKILILHGPNLNLLGSREPSQYGTLSLASINNRLETIAQELGHTLSLFQSNHESLLIERIHASLQEDIDFIIINPAALTHTSIALRDALLAVQKPFLEIHLSNIYARETFRHHSYFSDIALGVISGLGSQGYEFALYYAHHYLTTDHEGSIKWTCEKLEN